MKIIEISDPHRRKHFDFFRRMDQPHFNVTANVDIAAFLAHVKARKISFTAAMVYCVARTANAIPAFRRRIRGESVVEHEMVHPNFTLLTDASDVFSFCNVSYDPRFASFLASTVAHMERVKREPCFEDQHDRDDYLFLSAFPWVSFTSATHAMHYSPPDSVPRITWGKYFHDQGRISMPLSVQAHHAVVDGKHTGEYFQLIQDLFHDPGALEAP